MAGGILGRLLVEKLDDGRTWRVCEAFRYYISWPPAGELALFVDIPIGLLTDFASVPAIGKPFINPVGKIGKPAVIHDRLYKAPVVRVGDVSAKPLTRGECDQIFRDAMQACGVNWLERQTAWAAVRAGGWLPWKRYRAEDQAVEDEVGV